MTESRNPKDLWTPEGWRPPVDRQRKWRRSPAFKLPSCKWRAKQPIREQRILQGCFTPQRSAKRACLGQTSWNHALCDLENGRAHLKALKQFFLLCQLPRLCTNERNTSTLRPGKHQKIQQMLTKGKTTSLLALPLINHLVPKPIPQPDASTSHPQLSFYIPTPITTKTSLLPPLNQFKPIMSRPKSTTTLIGQRCGNHIQKKEEDCHPFWSLLQLFRENMQTFAIYL